MLVLFGHEVEGLEAGLAEMADRTDAGEQAFAERGDGWGRGCCGGGGFDPLVFGLGDWSGSGSGCAAGS